jgi:cell fate regulator YaaT (PSP1 superfamily)
MSNTGEYDNIDEDISVLEDSPSEEESPDVITGVDAGIESITPGTPIYRLRLFYSHETFLAVYRDDTLNPRSMVIVPTRYGRDLAQVIGPVRGRAPSVSEIAWIERPAAHEDLEKARNNRILERDAFIICKEKIENHRLDMKLVLVHYLLEEPKILFFFTADNRVDFRELVKDLVSVFKIRIELRQIGVRDEARVVGGLGVCGRGYCCNAVSDKLRPVSIKMAKDQNLSLNSMKISGPCGRLLCCLSYEHVFYSEQQRLLPPEGCRINYENTMWRVAEVNMISGQIKLGDDEGRLMTLSASRFERVDNRWRVKG